MADSWTITWADKTWSVAPFRSRATALEHAVDHYLEAKEAWDQVDSPAPRFRRDYGAAGDEAARAGVAAAACERYEAAVRRSTLPGRVILAAVRPYQGFQSLMIATDQGVFAAFGEKMSDMRTAYRPYPSVWRGPMTMQQYRDQARRKVGRF